MGALQDEIKGYFDEYYQGDSSKMGLLGTAIDRVDVGYGRAASVEQPKAPATPTTSTYKSSNKNYKKLFTTSQYASIENKAKEWGKDTDAIAGIIWAESNGNTSAVNPVSGATGLIQFMGSTAKSLGTTQKDILEMNFDQQLDLTGKYFKKFGNRWDEAKTATDLYALVFYPAMSGKEGDYVLGSQNSDEWAAKVAKQNKIFDLNKDNRITKNEFDTWGASKLKRGGIMYK